MKQLILYLVLLTLMGMQTSCSPVSSDQDEAIVDFDQQEVTAYIGKRKIYYRFPAPNDLMDYIKSEQLSFNAQYLNPTENTDRYLGAKNQLFNLGIFSADFAFTTLFRNISNASVYFGAIEKLAYKNGLSPVFNDALRSRVKRNQNDMDSLSSIARDSYIEMVNHLTLSGRERHLAIISAGGYLEVLHLILSQLDNVSNSQGLLGRVYDQRLGLDNLIKFMNDYVDDPWVLTLQKDLKDLYEVLCLGNVQPDMAVSHSIGPKEFAISGQQQCVSYSPEHLLLLKNTVFNLRSKYTNPFIQR